MSERSQERGSEIVRKGRLDKRGREKGERENNIIERRSSKRLIRRENCARFERKKEIDNLI